MERKRSARRYGSARYREKKKWTVRCKDYFRQFIAFMFSNVGIIGLVVGYTIAGAFVFIEIEGGNSGRTNLEVVDMRDSMVTMLVNLTYVLNVFNETHWKTTVAEELVVYQGKIVVAVMNGFDGSDVPEVNQKWSFPGAFLYALTVITTIGYGNVTPRTNWGKMTTVLYAIIGMPLFLLYLSNIGDILAKSFKWTYAKCCLCKGCGGSSRRRALERQRLEQLPPLPSPVNGTGVLQNEDWQVQSATGEEEGTEGPDETEEGEYDPQMVTVPVTLCLAIMVGYVCFGAFLFSKWENWEFLDGSYFCFISLSTIGFGDIVPGVNEYSSELSFIFCAMYLMLGMALIAMCFNLMQEEVVHKIRSCISTVRYITRCNARRKQQQEEAAAVEEEEEEVFG